MKPVTSAVLTDLPISGRWDFGGFAYGLEPLVLPPVGTPDAITDPVDVAPGGAYVEVCRRLRVLGQRGVHLPDVERCDVADELYWFRWITGHQICFVVWRLIAQLLDDVQQRRRTPDEVLEPVCRFVDGYSAMLLYTGSCPDTLYSLLIRPSMRLRHRAFSGSWAPDYWPIREVVHGRSSSPMWRADTGGLLEAVSLLQAVHDGVAAKLVADGRSLLRAASVRGPSHRIAGMIYDTYFMTLRGPVRRRDVVAQLLRRLVAVCQDLAANDLDLGALDQRPPELQAAEVVRCERSLVDVIAEVARCACELAPADVAASMPSALHAAAAEVWSR